jgi:hypothetical protein
VPEVYRSSNVKAAGKQLGSFFGRHPSHAEQQITESGKLLHAIEVLIATLSIAGKYFTGNRGGANDCSLAVSSTILDRQ